jgi:hypothetical protein
MELEFRVGAGALVCLLTGAAVAGPIDQPTNKGQALAPAPAFCAPKIARGTPRKHNRYYFVTTDQYDATKDGGRIPNRPQPAMGDHL